MIDRTGDLLEAARAACGGKLNVESFSERQTRVEKEWEHAASLAPGLPQDEPGGEGTEDLSEGELKALRRCRTEFAKECLRTAARISKTRRDVIAVIAVYGDLHANGR